MRLIKQIQYKTFIVTMSLPRVSKVSQLWSKCQENDLPLLKVPYDVTILYF